MAFGLRAGVLMGILAGGSVAWGGETAGVPRVSLFVGGLQATGQNTDLDARDMTLWSIPVALKIRYGRWHGRVSLSWLSVDQGGKTRSGWGDLSIALGFDVTRQWRITVKEKLATGDRTQGLSSGYNDTRVQLDGFTLVGARTSLFGTVGYVFKGGQSERPDYRNAVYASFGGGMMFSPRWNGGMSVDYAQSTNRTLRDLYGIALFGGYRFDSRVNISLFATYDNADTRSFGMGFSYRLQ